MSINEIESKARELRQLLTLAAVELAKRARDPRLSLSVRYRKNERNACAGMHEKGNSMSNLDIEFICDKYDMIGSLIYAMVDYVPGYGSERETHDRFDHLFFILEEEFNNTTKEFHTLLNEMSYADIEDQNDSDKIDEMRVTIERLKKGVK